MLHNQAQQVITEHTLHVTCQRFYNERNLVRVKPAAKGVKNCQKRRIKREGAAPLARLFSVGNGKPEARQTRVITGQ